MVWLFPVSYTHLCVCKADGTEQVAEIGTLWVFQGLTRTEVLQVDAGDIALVSKIDDIDIGDTIADPNDPVSIPRVRVEEPTIVVNFRVNDSPFAGTEGQYVTSRHLGERLLREAKKDVSLKVESTSEPDCFRVSGRGDLHLSVLMETMRREGYEMAVSRPEVILRVEDVYKRQEGHKDLIPQMISPDLNFIYLKERIIVDVYKRQVLTLP